MKYRAHRAHHRANVVVMGGVVLTQAILLWQAWTAWDLLLTQVIISVTFTVTVLLLAVEIENWRRCRTPLDAFEEVECPACGATIRARLADHPGSAR